MWLVGGSLGLGLRIGESPSRSQLNLPAKNSKTQRYAYACVCTS